MTAPLEGNILLCDSVSSPFILGVIRPKIYLPSDMDGENVSLCSPMRERISHAKTTC